MEKKKNTPGSLIYKGRPLVRSGKTMYYGDMSEKYVAMLQVLSETPFNDTMLPNRIAVQIWSTDEELRLRDRIIKKTEKSTLYDALAIASIWLERQLMNKRK